MKWLFTILLLSSMLTHSQELKLVASVPLVADQFIGIDAYDNTYFVQDMALRKEGPLGSFVFQDFQLGPLASVDIINPLNVVLFFEEANTVVFLDNRLNEIERLNFNTLTEFTNVGKVTNAGNNRLWLFNIDTQQLELYNYRSGRKTVVSQPFRGSVLEQASDFNYCYVLTDTSLYAFNIYGSILWKRPMEVATHVLQQDENLLLVSNGSLQWYPEGSSEPQAVYTPEINIKDLQLTVDFLYIYDGKKLHSFTLTQPKK
ncbi:hypothetical protein [Altibacter sp. HG106]|uniref:hypothetical protein n=1 Tax=Altibacter sp. HG106 TaxID=3023937 RepID=UPI00235008AF|nr:hypothetical protein [Altibacter sp. HG106]MDC7994561.1 hypothetical protein [Altibacter sp. HG106]